ncbi:hypothetical protein NKG94_27590 [Micromonospora sp. M12]
MSRSDSSTAPATRRRGSSADWVAVAVLLALVPVVHDLKTALTASYWLDEAWVALSVRLPLSDLPVVTSSTPLGWSLLLRLVPDTDYLRVVPIAFHGLRLLPRTRSVGLCTGRRNASESSRGSCVGGDAAPAGTADPSRSQAVHSRRRRYRDSARAGCLGRANLVAQTAACHHRGGRHRHVVQSRDRHRRAVRFRWVAAGHRWTEAVGRLREVAVAGLCTVAIITIIYFSISAQGKNDAMQRFWADSFPA